MKFLENSIIFLERKKKDELIFLVKQKT